MIGGSIVIAMSCGVENVGILLAISIGTGISWSCLVCFIEKACETTDSEDEQATVMDEEEARYGMDEGDVGVEQTLDDKL